ncbi:glycosyltransferase family 32 protein [Vibrio gallicus]|uniref:glycosyltransferase family 32 protein n=1 Tax=Vibrio gallicus TaxID=190897 RepID=UPI0021C41021|nr:glycosyltransferase [Vibrio gallicus]
MNSIKDNTIHAIWLGKKMTPLSFICINDWKKQGYTVNLWLEDNTEIIAWINGCEFARKCYDKKLYAFVTDYLRLKILQKYGGLYLDTDVTIEVSPFYLFEGLDFAVGYENDKGTVGTAMIYSNKNSIEISKLVDFYEHDIMKSELYLGPEIMTHMLDKNTRMDKVKLFNIEYFYSYQGEKLHFEKPKNAHLIHWFQHSWSKSSHKSFLKSKHKNIFGKIYEWQKNILRFKK